MNTYEQLDAWVTRTLTSRCAFVRTDPRAHRHAATGNNTPTTVPRCWTLRRHWMPKHPVPQADEVRAVGAGASPTRGRAAPTWARSHRAAQCARRWSPWRGLDPRPYGGEIEDGKIYGRARLR